MAGYQRGWLRGDESPGLFVVAIAIPLSMGMAEVAGIPPVAGLYTCVLPLVADACIGAHRHLVIGLDDLHRGDAGGRRRAPRRPVTPGGTSRWPAG